jgi:hypothetical protein
MGGHGSGRRRFRNDGVVGSSRSLDVSTLQECRALESDVTSEIIWGSSDRERGFSVRSHASSSGLLLKSTIIRGKETHDVEEFVQVSRRPCRFGGARPYFICPGVVAVVPCQRSVLKLYLVGLYFCCRHCHRLSFASQSYSELDRAKLKATKIAKRLDSTWSRWDGFPERPKGTWRRRYRRLESQALVAQNRVEEAWLVKADAFFSRRGFRRSHSDASLSSGQR